MSTAEVAKRTSLKRKLEDSELNFPVAKRQRLNEDKNEDNNNVQEQKDESFLSIQQNNDIVISSDVTDKSMNSTDNDNNNNNNNNDDDGDKVNNTTSKTEPTEINNGIDSNLKETINIKDTSNIINDDSMIHPNGDTNDDKNDDLDNRSKIIEEIKEEKCIKPELNEEEKEEEVKNDDNNTKEEVEDDDDDNDNDDDNDEIKPTPKKRKKRFVSDSESEDDEENETEKGLNTKIKTKFVYGDKIETIGKKIEDIIDDEEEEDDEDDDLDGFVVDDDDDDDEINDHQHNHLIYRRILRRNIENENDDFLNDDDDESEQQQEIQSHSISNRIASHRGLDVDEEDEEEDEEDDVYEDYVNKNNNNNNNNKHDINDIDDDSDESVHINMHRRNRRNGRNDNYNNHNRNNPDTPILIDDDDDNDEDDEDEEDDDMIDRRRSLSRIDRMDTTDSIRPRLLRFYSDEAMQDAVDGIMDIEEAEEVNHDDIEEEEEEEEEEDIDGEDIVDSDGESLDSMDEEIEKDIFGTDDIRLSDLTFSNVIKRKSLVDMIKIFEDGVDIKNSSFWSDYPIFIKIFNKKAIKAQRLLSFLRPLGFGHNDNKTDKYQEIGLYDPLLFDLIKKKDIKDIGIDEEQHPQEYEFLKCMKREQYDRIPAILEHGISPHSIPKFFALINEFRMIIIKKWFESIVYCDIDAIKQYHNLYGIPIDIVIPRHLIKQILETDFEHLQGATGLVIASLVNSLSITKYFVENGANIEYECKFGSDTALMHGAKRGSIDVLKYLLSKGANINTTTTQSEAYADTKSPVAFEALIHEQLEVLQYLTFYGADLYGIGPKNISGEIVNVIRLCLREDKFGMKSIENGLKKRFDLIKKYLSTQFSSDINIMNNIAFIICDQFLNPLHKQYIDSLKNKYMIDCDD